MREDTEAGISKANHFTAMRIYKLVLVVIFAGCIELLRR